MHHSSHSSHKGFEVNSAILEEAHHNLIKVRKSFLDIHNPPSDIKSVRDHVSQSCKFVDMMVAGHNFKDEHGKHIHKPIHVDKEQFDYAIEHSKLALSGIKKIHTLPQSLNSAKHDLELIVRVLSAPISHDSHRDSGHSSRHR